MTNQPMFAPGQSPEEMAIQRRLMFAQNLRQDQDPMQGQMVSGRYVPASFTQGLANVLKSYAGAKQEDQAMSDYKDLYSQRQAQTSDDLRRFTDVLRGKPAQPEVQGNNPSAYTPAQPATPGDPMAAYSGLIGSQDPSLRSVGIQGLAQIPRLEAAKEQRQAEQDFRMRQLQEQHQMRLESLAAQNASREQMMHEQQNFQREMLKMRQSMQQPAQPYFQPVQTAQGVFAFNARTGKMEPVAGPGGQPVVGAQADPQLQGAIAGAKASATTEGKARTEAALDLPNAVAQGEDTVRLVDDLLKAPGFSTAVGKSRLLGIQNIPGTEAKDFDVRLDQLKGKQFLQAFQSLKGGGQITEIEGKKATDAISRMNAASSEEEFTKAAREFQSVIRAGVERAKLKAKGGGVAAPVAPGSDPLGLRK